MTIRINCWPWNRRRELAFAKEAEEKRQAYLASTPVEPIRPAARNVCEFDGHNYQPLHKSAREVLRACTRCSQVQRIPLRVSRPPAPQPRFAHLA